MVGICRHMVEEVVSYSSMEDGTIEMKVAETCNSSWVVGMTCSST